MSEQTNYKQLVVFELDGEEYATPILDVKEVVKSTQITPVPDSPDYILGMINLRGKIAPIIDLEKRFGLIRNLQREREHIIMYEDKNNNLLGVRVDLVKGVIKVEEDSIKPTPKAVTSKIAQDYLNGVVILELKEQNSKRIILIINLPKILDEATTKEAYENINS